VAAHLLVVLVVRSLAFRFRLRVLHLQLVVPLLRFPPL
jgi:hypothetical protein